MTHRIPFNQPFVAGKELYYIAQAVATGNLGGDGQFTDRCSTLLQTRFGLAKALMTPSCTAALEMAAMLCELGPGDEVLLPSYTFVSTANAIVRTGAKPEFVDIRPDTLNMDESLLAAAITPRTKAIFVVHYAGVACEMDPILALAAEQELWVVEDAAQGVNAFYKGRALGSMGDLGTYSFHETKNYSCGQGGALCVNAAAMIDRAEILHDRGTNRKQFFRGLVDKYTWVDVGSAYAPSELACAFLAAQLELLEEISDRRRQIYERYQELLQPLEDLGLLRLPRIPSHCESNHHIFYVLLPDQQTRDDLLAHLNARQIVAVFHYVPLHQSPMGRKFGWRHGDLPITENLSGRLLRLPMFHEIRDADQLRIVEETAAFLLSREGVATACALA